ncbi:MAG: HAMP domain-containing histidine kinase [Bacteroidota bacterium]|nr:HAMP domain-containing histidine kinase [Bacteroidota bacterium]
MRLFTKYNRVNIGVSIFVFIAGSVGFYLVLHYVLIKQLDETLRSEKQEIVEYVAVHHQLPDIQNTKHQWITVQPTAQSFIADLISSYSIYKAKEEEYESVRQLRFGITVGNTKYAIAVNKSEVETEDILQLIILVTMGMIALILLLNYSINRMIINRLWQPFHQSVTAIKNFTVSDMNFLVLPQVDIDEFNLLNESFNKMAQNIGTEYHALKTFTENASHEMQTPLAVIRSKTEMLLQQTEWNEEAVRNVLGIEESIQKLSRLHQALLLLTKIGNVYYDFNETVQFNELIEQKLLEKADLLQAKELSVVKNIAAVDLLFHNYLAEILLNNLLGNAIKYTPGGGTISLELTPEGFTISNTAASGALDDEKIFQRFYKTEQEQEGIGLGLAIVYEIVKVSGFRIQYFFEEQQHLFRIYFNQEK